MRTPGPAGWVTRAGQSALAAVGAAVVFAVVQRLSGSTAEGLLGAAVVFAVWIAIGAGLAWLAGIAAHWFGGA